MLIVFSQIVFAAEESLISVESHVDRATITIGDRILYTLTVKTDPSLKLEPLALGSNLGTFEVKDYKIYDPVKNKEGKVINKSEYVITTFTTGEYVIPPIAIHYADPKGEKSKYNRSRFLFWSKAWEQPKAIKRTSEDSSHPSR